MRVKYILSVNSGAQYGLHKKPDASSLHGDSAARETHSESLKLARGKRSAFIWPAKRMAPTRRFRRFLTPFLRESRAPK